MSQLIHFVIKFDLICTEFSNFAKNSFLFLQGVTTLKRVSHKSIANILLTLNRNVWTWFVDNLDVHLWASGLESDTVGYF